MWIFLCFARMMGSDEWDWQELVYTILYVEETNDQVYPFFKEDGEINGID